MSAETETELNVEVAFSEQALTYRDNHQRSKVTSPNSPDDKLPVSHTYLSAHAYTRTTYLVIDRCEGTWINCTLSIMFISVPIKRYIIKLWIKRIFMTTVSHPQYIYSCVLCVNTLALKLYLKSTSRHYNVCIVSYSQYGCCMSAESFICVWAAVCAGLVVPSSGSNGHTRRPVPSLYTQWTQFSTFCVQWGSDYALALCLSCRTLRCSEIKLVWPESEICLPWIWRR